MIAERTARTTDVVYFGPFTLIASERLLMKEGAPVELSPRTLDILIALVSHPNKVLSKRELLARVWPDVTVEEGSLRFHVAGLRKALSDGKDGARYIITHSGRGYCFVAPISVSTLWRKRGAGLEGFAARHRVAAGSVGIPLNLVWWARRYA